MKRLESTYPIDPRNRPASRLTLLGLVSETLYIRISSDLGRWRPSHNSEGSVTLNRVGIRDLYDP